MATIRYEEARGYYIVDSRDAFGERKRQHFKTLEEAQHAQGLMHRTSGRRQAVVGPRVTFGEYAQDWLDISAARVAPQTLDRYRGLLDTHCLPTLGTLRLRDCGRPRVARLISSLVASETLMASSAGTLLAVLSGMYSAAVTDQLFEGNPLNGLGRELGLRARARREKSQAVKALDAEQLETYLRIAYETEPRHYAAVAVMAWAGLRQSECLALQWSDVKFSEHVLTVRRTLVRKYGIGPLKGGEARTIDMSEQLEAVLKELRVLAKAAALADGRLPSKWALSPELEELGDQPQVIIGRLQGRLDDAMHRLGERAGFDWTVSCHTMRHSFASQLLLNGAPILYVQQALGHAAASTTLNEYGHVLKSRDRSQVNKLSASWATSGQQTALPTHRGEAKVLGFSRTYNRHKLTGTE